MVAIRARCRLGQVRRGGFGYTVKVVKRNEQHLFQVLPKRWIVERTFAWINWSRRLSKDYELRHTSAEAMIYIAFAHVLLRRAA
jgi:putative transposase